MPGWLCTFVIPIGTSKTLQALLVQVSWSAAENWVTAVKRLKVPEPYYSQPPDVTCHMGSHSVICHMTQYSWPVVTQPDRLVLDLPTPDG